MALSLNIKYVWLKHYVYGIPNGRLEIDIESNREYYPYKLYIDGENSLLDKIEMVKYYFPPDFPRQFFETYDRSNRFEYKDFASRSFELNFSVYFHNRPMFAPPYSDNYYLNISHSNDIGMRIPIP